MKHRTLGSLIAAMTTVPLVLFALARISAADQKKAGESDAVAEGQKIYKQNCNMCHYPDKTDKKMGPGLKDLFKNKELPTSHKPVTEEAVREQIEAGSPHAKPMPMPAFKDKLSPAQIDSLIAYLKTL